MAPSPFDVGNTAATSNHSQILSPLPPEGWTLLNPVDPSVARTKEAAFQLNLSLRKAGKPTDLVTAVVQQSQLRYKARTKFVPFANTMVFTPAGREQATRLMLAGLHAQRFTRAGIKRCRPGLRNWSGLPRTSQC